MYKKIRKKGGENVGVYKRSGNWHIDYYVQGRRIREVVGRNKKQAEQALATRKAEILQGKFKWETKQEVVPFNEFIQQKYLPYSQDKKRVSTYTRDLALTKHLCNYFSDEPLSNITPEAVEKYMRWRKDGNDSRRAPKAATINKEIACLKNIFNMAIKWKHVVYNPVREVKFYEQPKNRIRVLSYEEQKVLLGECAEHLKPIVITALNTGMRKEEILSLTWEQVNFKEKLIQVGRGKTIGGDFRIIPMNSDLTGVLNRVKRIGTHVFCHSDGQRYGNIRTAFEKAVKRAGIPHIRFHDLRHTFATRYMGKGDVLTLKDILGHKTIEMTMRYAHPTLNKKRWCMEALNEDHDGHNMVTSISGTNKSIDTTY